MKNWGSPLGAAARVVGPPRERSEHDARIYRDGYGSLLNDPERGILELSWFEGTLNMADDEFMEWLERYAEAAEEHRTPHLLVDLTNFRGRPGEKTGPWRDENIVPRYNRAGVRKFAYLVPAGSPGTVAAGTAPAPEPAASFPMAFFDSREQAEAWLTE